LKQKTRITGASPTGVFYGVQSLRSLFPALSGNTLVLPALRVVDAPRFGYRGFMLDVARNFQPKPLVLRTLDLLARYKLNVFHFHLTEDEAWRVEIPNGDLSVLPLFVPQIGSASVTNTWAP